MSNDIVDCGMHVGAMIDALRAAPIGAVVALRDLIDDVQKKGGTLFTGGNGGGSTVAEHLALGMSLNALRESGIGMKAVCLSSSGAFVSAAVNDFGFEKMISVQLETLGRPGDAFIAISASGCSANLAHAVRVARVKGMRTGAIVGVNGTVADADVSVVLNTPSAAMAEDVAIVLLHWLYGTFMKERMTCV